MNSIQLKAFVNVNSIEEMIKENRLWTYLYMTFTILFIDMHFFVTSLYKIKTTLVFSIMIIMTVLIIPLGILNFLNKKPSVFQLLVIQGIDLTSIAAIWFCILFVKSKCNDILLNKWHIVTTSIMILVLIIVIVFRVHKLYKPSPKKKKSILYMGLFGIGMSIIFILRQFLRELGKETINVILSHGFIILSGIFLMLSSVVFLNAFVVKKHSFAIDELRQSTVVFLDKTK